ncbi:MAG: aspartate dehydrogenase [Rhizobiaceae bacterium]
MVKTVAIAGLGAIGSPVASELIDGKIPGLRLVAISARDLAKARRRLGPAGVDIPVVAPAEIATHADIVVECLPASAFELVAIPAIEQGRILLVLSAGALLGRQDLIDQARRTGARILVPSGAIIGLDAVNAAVQGQIKSVRIVTRKPPKSLAGAPLVTANKIDLDGLSKPLRIFEGSVTEAIRHFPANVNVAAAVSLAGIGPDRTMIEVFADPTIERNMQSLHVESNCSTFSLSIESIPSPDNPRTGLMTPLSVLAALRRLVAPISVGT